MAVGSGNEFQIAEVSGLRYLSSISKVIDIYIRHAIGRDGHLDQSHA